MESAQVKKPKSKKTKSDSKSNVSEEFNSSAVPVAVSMRDFEEVAGTSIANLEKESIEDDIEISQKTSVNSTVAINENDCPSANLVSKLPFDELTPTNSKEITIGQNVVYEPSAQSVENKELSENVDNGLVPPYVKQLSIYPSFTKSNPRLATVPTILVEVPPYSELEAAKTIATQNIKYPSLIAQKTAPLRENFNEAELLTESQLLDHYKNEQLDFVDDFTDVFVQLELEPRNCLFDLLQKFKDICEQLECNEALKLNSAKILSILNNEVWDVQLQNVIHQGKCECGKAASGEMSYKIAHLNTEKLVALSEELKSLNKAELDVGFCQEIRSRTLALQIQWIIVNINNRFFNEHQLSANSIPFLLTSKASMTSRILLKKALSDLFYFIRFPALSAKFRNSITAWISEIGAVLLRACTANDQLFLLSHVLRTPSPLGNWAISLIQTFILTPCLDLSVPIDSFVAVINLLLKPVKCREQFLNKIIKYYEGDNSWNYVSDNGSMENANFSDIVETDLITILGQFSVNDLFSVSLKHFTFIHQGNRLQILLSLISFVLVFLKICDEGMKTYLKLKNFCKRICDLIRLLVQNLCIYWDLVKQELNKTDKIFIQNEVNRIILQSVYYIISKKNLELWQFLVDFPFKSVTEYCRIRCQILLRSTSSISVRALYEIPDAELITKIKSIGALNEQLNDAKKSKEDITYKILALSSVISNCNLEQNFLVLQVIHLCFLDEVNREDYYKVGSEAVSLFLERNGNLLTLLLKFIDRNVDHLDEYAMDILTNSSLALSKCILSTEDVGNVLGKWLINRAIDHPASHIARRVLASMNWGRSGNVLWMSNEVHDACADAVVKAHIVHCKTHNGMIAKSVSKAKKLAMKCPDVEQQFDKFCWDILTKLKISAKPTATFATNDLTAFYLFIQQRCLLSYETFIDVGMKPFTELVNACCFKGAIVILSQLASKFSANASFILSIQIFRDCLERLIHADESAYALQLIVGADKFPGPILCLIGSSIEFQLCVEESISSKKKLALTWIYFLTCKKSLEWNADKFVIYLIGLITKSAFFYDPENFFGIDEPLENLYKAQFLAWKDTVKSPLSWFSLHLHPPIIASHLLKVSPWASFLMLRIEPKFFTAFYDFLNDALCKHPQKSLEEALKKACSKSHVYFTIERIHYARWLELSVLDAVVEHDVFPLVLQQLCCVLFSRKEFQRKKHCPGLRFLKCSTTVPSFQKLKCEILPKAEKASSNLNLKTFYHAVLQWIFAESIYLPDNNQISNYALDYLLQTAIVGENHLWIDLVDKNVIFQSIQNGLKKFKYCCNLNGYTGMLESPRFSAKIDSLTKFFGMLEVSSQNVVPILSIPQHKNLSMCEKIESNYYSMSLLPAKFDTYLNDFQMAAKTFVTKKEAVETLNQGYLDNFQKLYSDSNKSFRVVLKCSNFVMSRCSRPANIDITINASTYDQTVALTMNENRVKREEEINRLFMILDSVAIQCAHLEHISYVLTELIKVSADNDEKDCVKSTGINLFYKICNFVDGVQFLFPVAVLCYEACLKKLGEAFIFENLNEQLNLMRIVKAGNLLNHFLVPHFTPHCIPPALLFQLYNELSNSVRDASTSEASLALMSRLDIEYAGNRMPKNQFLALMPVIFENIAYVNYTSPLGQLCVNHFIHAMFHHFPSNFATGWRLILSGLDSQVVPDNLFSRIIARLPNFDFIINEPYSIKNAQTKMPIASDLAMDYLRICAEQLKSSRRLLNTRLFTVWATCLDPICKLSDYFIRLVVYQLFNSNESIMIIEKGLDDMFNLLVCIWGPLLEPVNNSLAPWNATENSLAEVLIDRFISNLIWLPHNLYMPPGSQTVESFFWQYFTSSLIAFQRAGTLHIFPIYEKKIVRLNWVRFWPTLLDLNATEKALVDGPPELSPLIVEVLVCLPWLQILQQQELHNQPEDANRAFYSLVLSIFARCIYRKSHYAKSRASMESLLKLFLQNGKWHYVKIEVVEKIGEFMVSLFPPDLMENSNEILKTFLCIWRETCFFSTMHSNADSNEEPVNINQKRAVYVKTCLNIKFKSLENRDAQFQFYNETLTKTNQLLTSKNKELYLCIVKELTAFWNNIPNEKDVEAAMKTLTTWLSEHCESPILLLIVNTAMNSLAIQLGLKLLDSCIQIYFHRRLSCEWIEISGWVSIPERSKEWLYTTPKSGSEIQPCFFVLTAYLMDEMSRLKSASDECKLLMRIADYISSIKPKYVTSEAAFLLCVEKWQKMVIRQYTNGVLTSFASEEIEKYFKWLRKVYIEEKSNSIFAVVAKFAARKTPTFSVRIQLFANIIDLYITQQQRSATQTPRLEPGQPVLNSRIHAFIELKNQKQFQELAGNMVFVNALPFFTNFEVYNLKHTENLFTIVAQSLYPNQKYLQKIA